jgi:hypothetical protein
VVRKCPRCGVKIERFTWLCHECFEQWLKYLNKNANLTDTTQDALKKLQDDFEKNKENKPFIFR